ncbi:Tyrosine-protein kinase-like otk [Frankliniella fusca]|uniref:Tyrosine-protein kinase-like otk n=1 Tax=Frankliniella fusca TaxID=407009 RepID=A0AAE1HCM0_9NEOP|nr:Tyrosine-protein kinase-like otk [Frankliniella fusca]
MSSLNNSLENRTSNECLDIPVKYLKSSSDQLGDVVILSNDRNGKSHPTFWSPVTTTGKQCYWRVSGEGKNPGLLREKQYESRKLLAGRVNFDPRPTAFKTDGPISEEELKEFKEDLEKLTPTCLFLYHLDSGFIPSTVMDSEVVLDLETNEGLLMLTEECSKLLWKLAKKCDGQNRPFEVPNTMGQHTSIIWHQERALCVNPSSAKTFLGLAKDITIIKWMRKKIWLMENFENEAMREGKRLEGTARKKCEAKLKRECNEGYSIIETGLWKNPKYPQMACSPDGLIILAGEQTKLLEIKVLTMVNYSVPIPEDTNEVSKKDGGVKTQDKSTNYYNFKTINPENFEEEMTKEQRSNFYLKRNKEGEIELKPKHQYNYQIQMSLDILELSECILCVYSTTGCLLVTVKYDPFFWEEKRARLIHKHRELIIPEAILGRTKRWLPPVKIMYSEFHEDPTDNYFETGASTKNLPYHVITW